MDLQTVYKHEVYGTWLEIIMPFVSKDKFSNSSSIGSGSSSTWSSGDISSGSTWLSGDISSGD